MQGTGGVNAVATFSAERQPRFGPADRDEIAETCLYATRILSIITKYNFIITTFDSTHPRT